MRRLSLLKNSKRRSHLTAVLLAVLLVAVIGGTVAYVSITSGSVKNEFEPSKITCEIEETVSGGSKSSVTVKNTGKTAAYIRVAVVANTLNDKDEIIGAADVSASLCGSGWVKSGKYYYYKTPVAPGASTGNLLNSSIVLTGKQVTILADAIQSEPADAALNAWGVDPSKL